MPSPRLRTSGDAANDLAPIAEPLFDLAPTSLPNRRVVRYVGDNLCVRLADLVENDRESVRNLYKILTDLLLAFVDTSTDDALKWQELNRWLEGCDLKKLIDDVRELGVASHDCAANEELAKAMHDVRGGALSALLGRLQLLDRLPCNQAQLKTLFVLTRDHLKIMRNAVTGLDDTRREADRVHKSHHIRLMLDKWHDSVVGPKWQERPIRMSMDCRYDGALTECCLESAAIDRIFYNLANNACRHAVGDQIDMAVFPLPENPACLRFVLSNEVNETDAMLLASLIRKGGADSADKGSGLSLLALFEPQVSSTGSGFGLTVVAEFVAEAFGLRDREEALRERYVGAVIEERTFRVWFHWPAASDEFPQKLDDYHHPEKNLSEPAPINNDSK
jgi:nitrogen-specific signal transduction histidine kinase